MALSLTTPPADEPVSVAEFKEHSRIDTDADDAYISTLITTARLDTETVTWRQLMTATYTLKLDRFPFDDYIDLPKPPLVSVTSVSYVDLTGTTQTFSNTKYEVDADGEPGRIYLKYGESWPSTRTQRNAVTIVYVAGYGDADDVPENIKHSIKLKAAHWYENREGSVPGVSIVSLPDGIRRLDDSTKFRGTINVYASGFTSP